MEEDKTTVNAEKAPETAIEEFGSDIQRTPPSRGGEISAATIGRMLGLASQTEIQMLEGKVDLAVTKIGTLTAKLERITGMLSRLPSGSDLERIDVQLGSLKSTLKEFMAKQGQDMESLEKEAIKKVADKIVEGSGAAKVSEIKE